MGAYCLLKGLGGRRSKAGEIFRELSVFTLAKVLRRSCCHIYHSLEKIF